ncbi:glutamate 5-kinase [Propionibacteriaceae bacterium G57]|uniref:glutamate 5-kinase n=1 Tax=Aestuariimicrobium sp. G57 TaxID=3418485 RepID=UPI003DA746E4
MSAEPTTTGAREALREASRIVVKVGSSSLTTAEGGLDPARLEALVETLVDVRASGKQVVLISSGAIAAGLAPLGMSSRPRGLAEQQAAASVGQGLLVRAYTEAFGRHGLQVGQVLLTVDDLTRQSTYKNAGRTLTALLRMQAVPVVNENDTVATHEIRFGDNDRLAALVAQLVRADALVLLTDVDALYTAHPSEPGSRAIRHVPDVEALEVDTSRTGSAIGTGGMVTKLEAAQIATSAGIPVLLTSATHVREGLYGHDIDGEPVGTWFEPIDKRRPRRLLWLAHISNTRGRLFIDAGAVRALTLGGASLLAVGVTGFEGDFVAGDPVDIVAPNGVAVARGLVGFSSDDLPAMVGRSSQQLADSLGTEYERALVHRDVLVLLHQPVGSRNGSA